MSLTDPKTTYLQGLDGTIDYIHAWTKIEDIDKIVKVYDGGGRIYYVEQTDRGRPVAAYSLHLLEREITKTECKRGWNYPDFYRFLNALTYSDRQSNVTNWLSCFKTKDARAFAVETAKREGFVWEEVTL